MNIPLGQSLAAARSTSRSAYAASFLQIKCSTFLSKSFRGRRFARPVVRHRSPVPAHYPPRSIASFYVLFSHTQQRRKEHFLKIIKTRLDDETFLRAQNRRRF